MPKSGERVESKDQIKGYETGAADYIPFAVADKNEGLRSGRRARTEVIGPVEVHVVNLIAWQKPGRRGSCPPPERPWRSPRARTSSRKRRGSSTPPSSTIVTMRRCRSW